VTHFSGPILLQRKEWVPSLVAQRRDYAAPTARPTRILLGCCLLVACLGAPHEGQSAPFQPSDDAEVLEQLPTARNATARELRALHAELAQSPTRLDLAVRVAKRDIEMSRAESDPRYDGYAEAALAPWWSLAAPPSEVLLLRATLRQSRHEFPAALDDLSRVVAADPRNAQAWLTRAVILEVQGDYTQALSNCLSVARLTGGLVAATCTSAVGSLRGAAERSYADLKSAFARASPTESPSVLLWAATTLAEIAARHGNAAAAEDHFKQAFSIGLRDGYLLSAYADFLLDQHRPREVVSLLRGEERIDPLLLRLALAEHALGIATAAAHTADLGKRFEIARRRGDTVHLREEARFTLDLLHRPREALPIAEANWRIQREPWDARLLLRAALAADSPAAAQPVREWLQNLRLEDVQLQRLLGEQLGAVSP
jgi:hypothetical protein